MVKQNEWTLLHKIESSEKWKAKCSCGNICDVWKSNVTSGKSTRCIKCQSLLTKDRMTTHNDSGTRLHNVWNGIKRRCYNQNQKSYKYYGAKGVAMCDEWVDNYEAFKEWAIANDYSEGMAISRFGDVGNYAPDNCKIQSFSDNAKEVKPHIWTTEDKVKQSIRRGSLSEDLYFEAIADAISGEYKSKEVCKKYSLDRHVLLNMCRLQNLSPVWRKTLLTNDQISELITIRFEQNLSTVELGKIFEVSHECIANTLAGVGKYVKLKRRK